MDLRALAEAQPLNEYELWVYGAGNRLLDVLPLLPAKGGKYQAAFTKTCGDCRCVVYRDGWKVDEIKGTFTLLPGDFMHVTINRPRRRW